MIKGFDILKRRVSELTKQNNNKKIHFLDVTPKQMRSMEDSGIEFTREWALNFTSDLMCDLGVDRIIKYEDRIFFVRQIN
jgi:hypothetical protein